MSAGMKLGAVLAASLIVLTSFACVVNFQQDEEPDDALPLVVPLVAAMLIGGAIGFGVGYVIGMADSSDSSAQPYLRWAESTNVTNMMDVASTFTSNAHKNYAQIWGMTKEHWIRQAELEAYSQWESGKEYDPDTIMMDSLIYENNSVMTANAVAQINAFFDELIPVVAGWQDKDTYRDKMTIRWDYGSGNMYTNSTWDGTLISVADSKDSTSSIYISSIGKDYIETTEDYRPGYLYNLSDVPVTITKDLKTYSLDPGITYLDDLIGFSSGVYEFSSGVIGGDCLVATADSIPLSSGLVMVSGTQTEVAIVNGDKITVDGNLCDDITLTLVPQNIPNDEDCQMPSPVSLKEMLSSYQALLDKLEWTTVVANNASNAVWEIYNQANAKNYNVTTLMNSNVYDVAVLSTQMQEALLLSAMEQLTSFYAENGEELENLKIGLYSKGMDAAFIRGNIEDPYGNVIYKDVIYTPFFQEKDVTISRASDHTVSQKTLVAIWNNGQDLLQWHADGMGADGYETVFVDDGHILTNTQLGECDDSGMANVESIEFVVTKVNYIEPGVVDPTTSPDVEESYKGVVQLVLIITGLICLIYGIVSGRYGFVGIGIAILFVGILFSDHIWKFIDKWILRGS